MDVSQVIEALSEGEGLPVDAIRAAQANRETMAPAFLRTIDDFMASEGSADPQALSLMFHLLGEWREKSAYRSLAALLRLPDDVVGSILGDYITETIHRVMAGVFDGDPEPLYAIIRDPEADEFVRAKMCQTIVILTRRGELSRDATVGFLRDCFSQLEPKKDCYVWNGWVDAVSWLGSTELRPLAQQVFRRGSIDPMWCRLSDFEKDFQYAVEHPNAGPRYVGGADVTPFGDTVAELSGRGDFEPELPRLDLPSLGQLESLYTPHREPLRRVGRNDPCPCGSGKKFKKCCLKADSDDFSAADPFGEASGPMLGRRQKQP
jgi:hypothetical protein